MPLSPMLNPLQHMTPAIYQRYGSFTDDCQSLLHSLFIGEMASVGTPDNQWTTKYFIIDVSGVSKIKGISLCLYSNEDVKVKFRHFVGEIKLMSAHSIIYAKNRIPSVNNLTVEDVEYNGGSGGSLRCTLAWSTREEIDHCNIYYTADSSAHSGPYNSPVFIGRSYCERFRVVDIMVNGSVSFIVQAISIYRQTKSIYKSPSITVIL
jgi:hypothetical protein